MVAVLTGCGNQSAKEPIEQGTDKVVVQEDTTETSNEALAKKYKASVIELNDSEIMVDGTQISTNENDAVYAANDIVFYMEGQDFTYGEGSKEDEHSKEEADAHTVVHITKPGNYVVSGKMSAGQIAVDLGEDADDDPGAVVTLIMNNADITCSVAPGVIFYNVYECGSDDEEDATKDVDTSKAGANVIIADDSVNNVSGSYVARIYESVELNEDGTEVVDSEKLHKYDAAFYSKRSMNMNGEEKNTGVLNIQAENEGLDSELHLTINGGIININSGNDGINTNEDGVSVTTINGGTLNIVVNGSTGEGDGIDSNGWLVINGGNVTASACGTSGDAGIDSDMGIHINGGSVAATGNMLDHIAESAQNYAVFTFMDSIDGGQSIVVKNENGENVSEYTPENNFAYLVVAGANLTEGTYTLWIDGEQMSVAQAEGRVPGGGMMPQGERPEMPEGEFPQGERPEMREMPGKPQGVKGRPDMQDLEASLEFTIKNGGNMFAVIKAE